MHAKLLTNFELQIMKFANQEVSFGCIVKYEELIDDYGTHITQYYRVTEVLIEPNDTDTPDVRVGVLTSLDWDKSKHLDESLLFYEQSEFARHHYYVVGHPITKDYLHYLYRRSSMSERIQVYYRAVQAHFLNDENLYLKTVLERPETVQKDVLDFLLSLK